MPVPNIEHQKSSFLRNLVYFKIATAEFFSFLELLHFIITSTGKKCVYRPLYQKANLIQCFHLRRQYFSHCRPFRSRFRHIT